MLNNKKFMYRDECIIYCVLHEKSIQLDLHNKTFNKRSMRKKLE